MTPDTSKILEWADRLAALSNTGPEAAFNSRSHEVFWRNFLTQMFAHYHRDFIDETVERA